MRVDDATLIERARQGSADALSTLYRRYWPLWTYFARIRPSVPRGSQLRAGPTLPQARPCYVGAFSNVLTANDAAVTPG